MIEIPPDIHIRIASYADAWEISRLKWSIEYEAPHMALGKRERKETIFHALARMFINRKRSVALVATHDKKIIGHVTLVFPRFKKLRGNVYLTIAVAHNWRGKKIGTALLIAAHNFARARGAWRMELEVFSKNLPAIALYERLGYTQEGVKRQAVESQDGFDDIIFMAKRLI